MPSKRKKISISVAAVAAVGAAGFLVLTSPWTWSLTHSLPPTASTDGPADIENGKRVFVASDCATCHATTGQDSHELLGGGKVLDTEFGKFHMPNISPDPEHGIGNWTLEEFDRSVREGVSPDGLLPDGKNLYPAFPYTSYQRLKPEDVRDLYAYMMTLPESGKVVPDHELKFPYNLRRGIGVWRLVFLDGKSAAEIGGDIADLPEDVDHARYERGRYLVESAAHCVECHSPRTFMGNIPGGKRYAGGPDPEGHGYIPNITPDETGIGFWSAAAIANYLHTGVNPIGRESGGDMAEVIENTLQLPWEDLQAMATYLNNIPAVDAPAPGMPEPNFTEEVVMLDTAVDNRPPLPTSDPQQIDEGDTVFVAGTKSLYTTAELEKAEGEDGKLLGGTQARVVARQGDKLQLEIDGWQPENAPSVIYQAIGQRVIMAALGDDAVAATEHGEVEVDPNTDQVWRPVTLQAWSDASELNLDQEVLWSFSENAYQESCSSCHTLAEEDHFTANQWVGTLKSMKRFTSFTDDEYRLILSYLQNHSSDLGSESGEAVVEHAGEGVPQ
ncbi:c-type cytochrome [Halomonas halodenitrificans]|uniref:c-type cytochrome n=1 Tax=Halomonas halodenitrificans TaxID=28252 RepID=UPI0004890AC7|nr:c-type cytochrome [Halomonas halodenitrificans]